jgi:hypothetical protein
MIPTKDNCAPIIKQAFIDAGIVKQAYVNGVPTPVSPAELPSPEMEKFINALADGTAKILTKLLNEQIVLVANPVGSQGGPYIGTGSGLPPTP